MITEQHSKELLCRSYLTAVAGQARQNIKFGRELDYGVDGSYHQVEKRGKRHYETGIAMDFQAKASVDWFPRKDNIVYDLEKKAFDDLVARSQERRAAPFFLILLCLPKDESSWASFGPDELIIKKCAYYGRPHGLMATDNQSTKRIEIPIANALSPSTLLTLLEGIRTGGIGP